MLNALRKIHLHVYRPLRLILDFDSLSSRKKKLYNFLKLFNKTNQIQQFSKPQKSPPGLPWTSPDFQYFLWELC